nr:Endo-N-acetylneuraminidase [uncultured Mediterranean phage uvMED]
MAQHDYNIANQTGANFRTDLNNALLAISSNNSGSSEPSTTFAYEWWIDTSANVLKLRNSANNAWITMPFSITADNTIDINAGTVNGITSFSFSSGSTVTSILDEDNLSSDSATALATQQSIKAYVDSQVTAQDLDISDGSSTISIDLDSETLSLLGGTGVTSAASGNGVTFAIGQSVGTSDNVVFNQVTGALVGNASTATALATARTIGGTSFDGTANIAVNLSATATALANARTISGVSFDGTANITLDTDDIGEGSSNKYFTAERVDDQVNTLLTAGANISLTYDDAGGTLTIANTNSADITSVVAGDGLTGGGTAGDVTLAVGVDDSSIEINSDALRVKASGITNAMLGGSIANAKLANSSVTINSQAIALGGSHTFDTDDIGEGSSNLYYTDARANSAIDARVTNTFINNLSGVVADTSTALATARSIALSGDVTASGVNFDGTGDITLSTTIAANSVALGTDTTGNYVATISGTTNEIDVSGSGSETATVTIGLPDDVTIAGNLTVNGTTTTVNSDTLAVTDPLIKLAKANSGADSLDIGFYGLYDTSGSQDLYAGLFRDANDSGKFKLFKDLQVEPTTTVNTSGTGYAGGTLVATFEGNITGNVTGQVSTLSNHDTDNLSEGSSNLYFTNARSRSAISASGDISYNSSTGVISFTQSSAPVTSVNSATGAVTLDTDDIAEGSSNLYMTTERVQDIIGGMVTGNTETGITVTYDDSDGTLDFVVGTLNQDTTGNAATATALETARTIGGVSFDGTSNIDLAGVNTSGNQDTSGNAATATALAAGRTIGMTGDVVWTSASFDGSGNVTGTATIQANSVALGTDTTGDYVGTITGGTGITSTGATSGEGVAHSLSVDAAQTQITSVGALDGGSITSGFGSIDVGSSAITTTGTVTGGTLAGTLSTAAQTNITSVGTLSTLTVDDITINGSTISDAGDLTLDINGNIQLDANDNGEVRFLDDGTQYAAIKKDGNNALFQSIVADGDFIIQGIDGSSFISAVTLDMSDAGTAKFNNKVGVNQSSPQAQLHTTIEGSVPTISSNTVAVFNRSGGLSHEAYVSIIGGASGASAIHFGDTADEDVGRIEYRHDSNYMAFNTNAAERMRIDASGRVLIGADSGDAFNDDAMLRLQRTGDRIFQSFKVDADQEAAIFFGDVDDDVECGIRYQAANRALEFSTGNNAEAMRIASDGNVGIGATPEAHYTGYVGLDIGLVGSLFSNSSGTNITTLTNNGFLNSNASQWTYKVTDEATMYSQVHGDHRFSTAASGSAGGAISWLEKMRLDASGNLLVGTSSLTVGAGGSGVTGFRVDGANGIVQAAASGNTSAIFNRTSSDGDIVSLRKDGTEVGRIGAVSGDMFLGTGDANIRFTDAGDGVRPATSAGADFDDHADLGAASARFNNLFLVNNPTVGSDENLKQDIEQLSEAEKKVAVKAKGLIRKYKYKNSIRDKGENARIHIGIIAQELQDAFSSEGLDAYKYSMFCSDTWTDEETGEEKTQLGIRYTELLAFIIAAI